MGSRECYCTNCHRKIEEGRERGRRRGKEREKGEGERKGQGQGGSEGRVRVCRLFKSQTRRILVPSLNQKVCGVVMHGDLGADVKSRKEIGVKEMQMTQGESWVGMDLRKH